jgi:hypothetical protein
MSKKIQRNGSRVYITSNACKGQKTRTGGRFPIALGFLGSSISSDMSIQSN